MAALATLEELEANLDWDLDVKEKAVATADLDHASELVRHHGLNWTPENVPPIAKSIVLQAARRHMNNLMGNTVSRAGDETLGWDGIGDKAGSVYLTNEEKQTLSIIKRGPGFGTGGVIAWGTRKDPNGVGYVPVERPDGRPFPFYSSDTEPW